MRFPVAKAFLLAVLPMMAGAAADSLGFNPEKNPEKALGMYIAPENSLIYRMRQPDGSTREFERIYARPGTLASVRGWKGRFAKEDSWASPVRVRSRFPSTTRRHVLFFPRSSRRY